MKFSWWAGNSEPERNEQSRAGPIVQKFVGERRIYDSDCEQRIRLIEIGTVTSHELHEARDPRWKEKDLCELDP